MNHTTLEHEAINQKCGCEPQQSIPFLDTLCTIKEGRIETDLYKKETDRNQYLLPTSCHPATTNSAIPIDLSMRIIRICNNPEKRDHRLNELKGQLLERGYSSQKVQGAIDKARAIPREIALRKVTKNTTKKGPIFVHTYDPRLPSIPQIQGRHWRSIKNKDSYLGEVFPRPPIIAYRRQPNLRNLLVRAKVPKNSENKRKIKGMTKCGKSCPECPFIKEGKSVKIYQKEWRLNSKFDCNSFNVIYVITCQKDKCRESYIGETKRMLKYRLADHYGFVRSQKLDTPIGAHFNSPGHTLGDLAITVIEKSKRNNHPYRRQREEYHKNRFNTYYKGMNKQK